MNLQAEILYPDYQDYIEELVEEKHVLIHMSERTSKEFVKERIERHEKQGFKVSVDFQNTLEFKEERRKEWLA